jgi:hypothetical protein
VTAWENDRCRMKYPRPKPNDPVSPRGSGFSQTPVPSVSPDCGGACLARRHPLGEHRNRLLGSAVVSEPTPPDEDHCPTSCLPKASAVLKRNVPFFCVPVGTRNHFALDLGLNRDDPLSALDAVRNRMGLLPWGKAESGRRSPWCLWHLFAPPARLERATCGLEVRCSIQLSYGGRTDEPGGSRSG